MMAFAGGAPIWGPYLKYKVRDGMFSPRFDLSLHHNVFCRLSFKNWYLFRVRHVITHIFSSGSGLSWIPFNLVKGFAFGQDRPDCASHFVGYSGHNHIEVSPLQ